LEKKNTDVSRREFIKATAGAAVGALAGAAVGAAGASALLPPTVVEKEVVKTVEVEKPVIVEKEVIKEVPTVEVPESGVIAWNPDECAACSRCLMACATYHEGAVALHLSRIKWFEEDYLYGFRFRKPLFCEQCQYPECYFACPLKDKALCIDGKTGARYINMAECNGCGLCIEACPLDPPRISLDPERRVAIKCDLCKDREGGPVCVEVCDRKALTFISKEQR
jgi:Fe-S-cluster-containing hydrogenase component 2